MKNGFTIIELLAVIVILSILALIAVPTVISIINNSSNKANERSVDVFGKAVKNSVLLYEVNNGVNVVGSFESVDKTKITNGSITLEIEYEGNVLCETIEIYEDRNIYLAECTSNGTKIDYT